MNDLKCPVCGSEIDQVVFRCKDYSVSGESFDICVCPSCTYGITMPQPDSSEIGKYYQTEDYVSHSDTKKGIVNRLYHIVRKRNTKNKLQTVNQFSLIKGDILDVGCGTGYFLSVCKEDGWNIAGVEPSGVARAIAEKRTGQSLFASLDDLEQTGKRFEIVTLWHVFEHLYDIDASLQQLLRLLKPGGVLLLALPNPASADAKYYKQFWAAYDVPRHLSHFTPQSMDRLTQKHGLKIGTTIPMRFDAFYISMLSEGLKGRGKLSALLKGGWNGFVSDWKARQDGNYSSLIYVIK